MPLILGTNSIKDTGYEVANSCRFNDDSDDHLDRTPSSSGNRRTWTWSCWFKRSSFTNNSRVFVAYTDTSNRVEIGIHNESVNCFRVELLSSSSNSELQTDALFRDPSAWFHAVVAVDTTQGTASNRVKIYINGTQVTSFRSSSYPDQNTEYEINHTVEHNIGKSINFARPYDGYMCEVVLIDGQQLDATSFGEFDSDSPTVWKPIDVSGLTFGTNGFYLDFEDSSNLGNDAAGSNNFTVNNLTAIDQSTDTCTNNFCTWNPLANYTNGVAFSEGNLEATSGTNDQWDGGRASIGFSQGKWYFECLFVAGVSTQYIGVQDESAGFTGSSPHDQNGTTVFYNNSGGEIRKDGSATTNDYGTFTSSQVAGIGIDADNFTISVYKGGSAIVNAYALSTTRTGFLFPFTANLNNGDGVKVNFGSPPYSESGGNTDANGYGNFNQSVPSGYFAINSKNLAEYG